MADSIFFSTTSLDDKRGDCCLSGESCRFDSWFWKVSSRDSVSCSGIVDTRSSSSDGWSGGRIRLFAPFSSKSKSSRLLFSIIFILFDISLILLLGVYFYLSLPIKSEKILFIPQGSTKAIITYLQDKHYDVNEFDKYFLRLIGKPQSGWIEMPDETLTKLQFFRALTSAKAAMTNITLIPGETKYFFLQQIAKQLNKDFDKFESYYKQYAPYDDGVILANTYSIPYHADEEFIMRYLIEVSLKQHRKLAEELLGSYDEKQWFQYISKASIIQKEAANVDEMPIVSSVIDNRITKGMPLQMDGSLNYGKYSHTRITPDRIRNDLSEFNTYKHLGIPKTPSGSVSIDSIKAAIQPAKTQYLYFMRNKQGTHDFSESYKGHLQNIKKVKN